MHTFETIPYVMIFHVCDARICSYITDVSVVCTHDIVYTDYRVHVEQPRTI